MKAMTTATIKLQAVARLSIKRRRYLSIKRAIIARRLFLFCEEKDVPDELIVDAMELHCNRINNKFGRLETMIILLNLFHNKGFYFTTGN